MSTRDTLIAHQAIRLHLVRLLPLEEHDAWLHLPRIDLNGISPAQAMKAGRHEAVLRVLRLMQEKGPGL